MEETDSEFHFTVDKEKAMRNGLTVAQVYMQVAKVLTSDTTSTQLSWEGDNYDVVVSNPEAIGVTIDTLKNLRAFRHGFFGKYYICEAFGRGRDEPGAESAFYQQGESENLPDSYGRSGRRA